MTKELKFYDQGFEEVVRCELHIADRPITEEDALKAHVLDCLDFFFDPRDYDALSAFKNLTQLSMSMNTNELDFLDAFPDTLTLKLSGIQVKNGINYDKLSRFVAGDFNDIEDI